MQQVNKESYKELMSPPFHREDPWYPGRLQSLLVPQLLLFPWNPKTQGVYLNELDYLQKETTILLLTKKLTWTE